MTGLMTRTGADGRVRSRPTPSPEVYDNVLGRATLQLASTTEGDPIGVLASLVSMVSSMIGPRIEVKIDNDRHPLLVWTLMVGSTAAGRKGTATGTARRLIAAVDPTFMSENVMEGGLSSGEGLVAALQDPDPEDDDERRARRKMDKRRVVIETEYASVLERAKRQGNSLSAILRCAWDGSDLQVHTKKPLIASEPHVTMIGHISPIEFRDRTSKLDLAGGTYNRFLLIYVERAQQLPLGGGAPDRLIAELASDLRRRLEAASQMFAIGMATEAESRWVELYGEFSEIEHDEEIGAWAGRASPYVRRLAALYAALDGRVEVGTGDLNSAAALVRYGLESARFVVGRGGAARGVRELGAFIAEHPDGATRAAIGQKFKNRFKTATVEQMLASLTEAGLIETETVHAAAGRPTTVYRMVRDEPEP